MTHKKQNIAGNFWGQINFLILRTRILIFHLLRLHVELEK